MVVNNESNGFALSKAGRLMGAIGLSVFIALYSGVTYPNERPVIALSVGGLEPCPTAYIIEIFDDGFVHYKGVNKVKVYGHQETQIDRKALDELIKYFENKNFMDIDDRSSGAYLQWNAKEAIRMRKGANENTVRRNYRLLEELRHEIIHVVQADQWVYEHVDSCYEK
jgi:hypothetical protein